LNLKRKRPQLPVFFALQCNLRAFSLYLAVQLNDLYLSRIKFLFLSIIFFPVLSLSQIKDGLVAKYSFNNADGNDEVSKNNAKVYGATLIEDRFGNERSAYFIHGNRNSFLNLGTRDVLKPVKGSISIWIKIEHEMESGKGVETNPILITRAHDGERHCEAYYIGYDFKTKNLNVNTTFSKLDQISVYSILPTTLREWHHVVMTYDDDFLSFYLDGVLETKMPKNFKSRFLNGDSVLVGYRSGSENERFFNGGVDDIEFYNRVLSAQEVLKLYNGTDPKPYKSIIKWGIIILLGLTVVVLFTIFIVKRTYRRKLERQQALNNLNTKMNELETKAIRTQMNPHFIFNSLNTLQRFILEEDTMRAQLYLTKFSKLLRKMLESSTADAIALSEEIEILNTYIEVEKLRFHNSFEYEIEIKINEPGKILIPFMLIQPFVENAIWHGLIPKKGDRFLKISFSDLDNGRILCTVDDNGVGRDYKGNEQNPLKKKSLAIEFIRQRLELLEKSTGKRCAFKIIDKKNEGQTESIGTTVAIIIPKLN
jgi:hypothetical protein